ncbi:MAG: cobalt-precorrin-6A reductase [Microlunatus sp.]
MSRPSGRVLILGGTAEARALASELVARGCAVVSSLAGRVRDPALPVGEVRIGGFSTASLDGIGGLAAYLVEQHITAVVDATHPFAATISTNAVAARGRTGTPLIRLQRPGWRTHPDADRWLWVDSVDDAVEAGGAYARPFLTTGRQSLSVFAAGWAEKDVTARVVDPPEFVLPSRWQLIRSRGPYAYADEHALMKAAGTDLLVTKDSGGTHTAAKLDAARDLGIQVLVIARPAVIGDVTEVSTTAEVLDLLKSGADPSTGGIVSVSDYDAG